MSCSTLLKLCSDSSDDNLGDLIFQWNLSPKLFGQVGKRIKLLLVGLPLSDRLHTQCAYLVYWILMTLTRGMEPLELETHRELVALSFGALDAYIKGEEDERKNLLPPAI